MAQMILAIQPTAPADKSTLPLIKSTPIPTASVPVRLHAYIILRILSKELKFLLRILNTKSSTIKISSIGVLFEDNNLRKTELFNGEPPCRFYLRSSAVKTSIEALRP
jgi:hypothetical protein